MTPCRKFPVGYGLSLLVAILIAAPKVYYILQVGRRKKEAVRFRARRAVVALGCYLSTATSLLVAGLHDILGLWHHVEVQRK